MAAPEALVPPEPLPQTPVPYSLDGRFVLGQRIIHKIFGEVVVTALGATSVEVQLSDGSKKTLAQDRKSVV